MRPGGLVALGGDWLLVPSLLVIKHFLTLTGPAGSLKVEPQTRLKIL